MEHPLDNSPILIRAGSQPSVHGLAERYTGDVSIDPIFDANQAAHFVGVYVSFKPGARTAWHIHPAGQHLIVSAGSGLIQEWGGQIVELQLGDVYWVRPGVKHWHGASATSAMTHIAITGMIEGKTADWLEKVTDAEYCP
jgi:quercetin dioxygenase-like cupin family protein